MAKSNNFFSLRRGSTKSHTYQVNKGQQITKDRVYGGHNPRSDGQMTQRSTFLSAVRFYQRANQRFFRFAFESKTQTESDYNAFMRNNAKIGPYITKAQGDAIGFPMVAPWVLSQGSLESPATSIQAIGETGNGALMLIADEYSGAAPSTIGQVSELILSKYAGLRAGDFITMVVIESQQADGWYNDLDATTIPVVSPNWMIKQIRLDPTDEGSIFLAGFQPYTIDGKCYLGYLVPTARNVLGCAFVASRDESTGVKVSTSTIVLSEDAQTAYEAMRTNAHRELVMSWWGAQQKAILQGALVQ